MTFPRSEFADATLSRPGEVRVVEGVDCEGHRHVLIIAGIIVAVMLFGSKKPENMASTKTYY